jgi:hypothetical protein
LVKANDHDGNIANRAHTGKQTTPQGSVMRCSNPDCARGIGLISHRRGWFGKRRYCSRKCRDAFVAEPPGQQYGEWGATTYLEWLFVQPTEPPGRTLHPAIVHVKAR